MPEIKLISNITVRKIQSMGGDHMVVAAMMVSTTGEEALKCLDLPVHELRGRIRFLMAHRHGTPFEQNSMTFFVHAPIFVWREWHRHRIGFSYNEESGRYKVLEPVFYIPPTDRPMVKVENWKPGRPKFVTVEEYLASFPAEMLHGKTPKEQTAIFYEHYCEAQKRTYEESYLQYTKNLSWGFMPGITIMLDPGLARDCLPVGIYSSCWVTCNARSLMHFLSLRTHEPEAAYPSYPLYEIEVAARVCESMLAEGWPITYEAFQHYKRVAP